MIDKTPREIREIANEIARETGFRVVLKNIHLTSNHAIDICYRYQQGESQRQIAREYGVRQSSIQKLLKQRGISARTPSESRRVYTCNHEFFSKIITETEAYWLGFVAGDGCVLQPKPSKEPCVLAINLAPEDENHLIRLKKALQSTHPLYQQNGKGGWGKDHITVRLSIRSPKLARGLIQHGVHPRKTFTLRWPDFLSNELLKHYTRGYMDANGCLCVEERAASAYPQCHFSIGSNQTFLRGMQQYLMNACRLSRTKISGHKKVNAEFGVLKYSGNIQVARIFRLLYEGATIFLPRKREKVEYILFPNGF